MNTRAEEIKLRRIEQLPTPPIHAARLVPSGTDIKLVMSSTQAAQNRRAETFMFSAVLGDSASAPSPVLSIPQLLPAPPGWDASLNPGGNLMVAYQASGGALSAISLRSNSSESPTPLTASHPFEDFSHPRFLRGQGPTPLLISMIADSRTAVVFELPSGKAPGKYRKLGACEDVLLTSLPKGFGLFCKTTVPGPSLQNVLPGTLSYVSLGEDFTPQASPVALLGGQPVYEFDVALFGKRFAVLAVTATGPKLETFEQPPGQLVPLSLPGDAKRHLSSPSLQATNAQLHLSLVGDAGAAGAHVFIGQAPLTAF